MRGSAAHCERLAAAGVRGNESVVVRASHGAGPTLAAGSEGLEVIGRMASAVTEMGGEIMGRWALRSGGRRAGNERTHSWPADVDLYVDWT